MKSEFIKLNGVRYKRGLPCDECRSPEVILYLYNKECLSCGKTKKLLDSVDMKIGSR